jgi:hypothetical protein
MSWAPRQLGHSPCFRRAAHPTALFHDTLKNARARTGLVLVGLRRALGSPGKLGIPANGRLGPFRIICRHSGKKGSQAPAGSDPLPCPRSLEMRVRELRSDACLCRCAQSSDNRLSRATSASETPRRARARLPCTRDHQAGPISTTRHLHHPLSCLEGRSRSASNTDQMV